MILSNEMNLIVKMFQGEIQFCSALVEKKKWKETYGIA